MASRIDFAARVVFVIITIVLTGCATNPSPLPTPMFATPATVDGATAMPTPAAIPLVTSAVPIRTPILTTGAVTLTLWTTEDLAPGTTPAGRILRNQFDAFSAANPDIHIDVVLKKPYGKGGMLDFMTTTSMVVPEQLPDLATLDMAEVPQAAAAGILQSLDPILAGDIKSDLFPFAFQAAQYQGKWVAVPFTADVEHLVYSKTAVKKAPQTWDDVLKQKNTLLFPVGGDDAFLVQYLAIASLFDQNNQLAPDANAASQVLNFLKRTRDLNLMPDTAVGLKSSDEAWSIFAAGKISMVQAWASRYLAERDKLPDAMYASIPTRDGKVAAIGAGWAFVIVTGDPARQAAAARFIQWLVQGEHLAPWLRAARRLPASRSTLILSADPIDYATFLREPLERAAYLPPNAAYGKAADAWRAAVAAVWKGQATPDEAARGFVTALK